MTLPALHPHHGLAQAYTETMSDSTSSKEATPHTSHASKIKDVSSEPSGMKIGDDREPSEKRKAARLAELKMRVRTLEEKLAKARGASKDAANYLRQSLKSGNAAMAYTLIDSAINTLEDVEADHD